MMLSVPIDTNLSQCFARRSRLFQSLGKAHGVKRETPITHGQNAKAAGGISLTAALEITLFTLQNNILRDNNM